MKTSVAIVSIVLLASVVQSGRLFDALTAAKSDGSLSVQLITVPAASHRMRIYLESDSGGFYYLDVERLDSVRFMKDMLELEADIEIDRYRFIYDGIELDDNRTLEYYKIGKYSTISMYLKRK